MVSYAIHFDKFKDKYKAAANIGLNERARFVFCVTFLILIFIFVSGTEGAFICAPSLTLGTLCDISTNIQTLDQRNGYNYMNDFEHYHSTYIGSNQVDFARPLQNLRLHQN